MDKITKVNGLKKVLTVVGARPQIVKAAVISNYLKKVNCQLFEEVLVHTGQHYDALLSDIFFRELGLAEPKYNLNVGSHEPTKQVAMMLERIDGVIKIEQPNLILVYGDTNSTLAAAICSMYKDIPLVHVEAGERIFRRRKVPEEANRVVVDNISFLCLTSTERARNYLIREGMSRERVKFVGDPMYDLFKWGMQKLDNSSKLFITPMITPTKLGLKKGGYHLCTIHRVENTYDTEKTIALLKTLDEASKPVVLPIHPRLHNILKKKGWEPKRHLKIIEPLGYFEFLSFLKDCEVCITDSGGVTREAFFARKPCIIPMNNSWWTDIVQAGWALEIGENYTLLAQAIEGFRPLSSPPENLFGDGNSAEKIVKEINLLLEEEQAEGKWHEHGNFTLQHIEKSREGTFSYEDYERLVNTFKENGYLFVTFAITEKEVEERKKIVLLRHDVDLDLPAALRLAELEHTLGVRATYFFLLRTEHYNLFSKEGYEIVLKILQLGHELGLHFNCAQYQENMRDEELALASNIEAEILEKWFFKKIEIISYHRPNKNVLQGRTEISFPRKHTYIHLYCQKIKYVSDSKGEWKFGSPLTTEEFKQGLPLQILVHPIWWNQRSTSAYDTLLQFVQDKKERLERSIATNCKVYQRGYLKIKNLSQ